MPSRQGAKGRDDRSQSSDWTEAFGTALGRNQSLTRVLTIAAIVIAAAYLTARLLFTMQGAMPWAFWLLFLAEAFTLVSLLLHAFDTWRFHLTPEPPPATLTTDIVIAQGLMTIRRVTRVAPEVSRYAGTVEWDSPVDRWNVLDFCYVELAGKDRQHLVLESEVARY